MDEYDSKKEIEDVRKKLKLIEETIKRNELILSIGKQILDMMEEAEAKKEERHESSDK
jgi:3-hydroxyisobutyrate dehydrogenase-like beta-hydroxyacid dehydrogenase